MHSKYIITYECHDNAPRMWKVVQLIREIFWLLPVLSPLLPVVSHFSFVSTWKRSHFSLWFQSSGSLRRRHDIYEESWLSNTIYWSKIYHVVTIYMKNLGYQTLYTDPKSIQSPQYVLRILTIKHYIVHVYTSARKIFLGPVKN